MKRAFSIVERLLPDLRRTRFHEAADFYSGRSGNSTMLEFTGGTGMRFEPSGVSVGGQVLYVELADHGPSTAVATTDDLAPVEMLGKLGAAGVAAGEACKVLFGKIDATLADARPEEITIEFGITLGGEAGCRSWPRAAPKRP